MVFTNTGVKHLHVAAKQFDVGIYFEANGHGTVLFKASFLSNLESVLMERNLDISDVQRASCLKLLSFSKLINPYVGDALSDLLAVEAILYDLKMTVSQWDLLYEPLPNKTAKIQVKDRTRFKTTNAERLLVEPQGIQAKMDALLDMKNPLERAFVR